MRGKVFKNPEMKKMALLLLCAAVLIAGLAFLDSYIRYKSLSAELIRRNTAAMGILAEKHPELSSDIAAAFTREPDSGQLQKGLALAQKYGYTESLPLRLDTPLHGFYSRSLLSELAFVLLLFGVLFLIVYISLRGIYGRVGDTARAIEEVMDGNFHIKLPDELEGDFSKLGHQFNQMSKRLELTLEQLQSEKLFLRDTISDISHQLKTPLAALEMFNELLMDGALEDREAAVRFLEESKIQLERMEWLIKSLLKLARLDAGAIEFKNERLPLHETLEEALFPLSVRWKQKGQSVEIRQEGDIRLLHDKRWLAEAFTNIVKNCIEHTPEGGSITIEAAETPVMVRLTVADNGEGIAPEDLPRVFERFYKGRSSVKERGTGIGLALAKSIIESQGGMITVKSALNKGTVFTITFPRLNM